MSVLESRVLADVQSLVFIALAVVAIIWFVQGILARITTRVAVGGSASAAPPPAVAAPDEEVSDGEDVVLPPQPPPPVADAVNPHPDLQSWARANRETVKNVTILVVAIAIVFGVVISGRSGGGGGSGAYVDGGASANGPVHSVDGGTRFFLPPGRQNKDHKRVPYVTCQYHPRVDDLHDQFLGPRIEAVAGGGDDVSTYAVDDERERARHQCIIELGGADMLAVDQSKHGHAAHLERPMFWSVPAYASRPRADWVDDAAVDCFFLTARGEKYFRVMVAHATPNTPGVSVRPMLVSDSELVRALDHYYNDMLVFAHTEECLPNPPCMCVEFLGPLDSNLFALYDAPTQTWKLILAPEILRDLTQPDVTEGVRFRSKIPFPHQVDRKFNATVPPYHGRVQVQYVDLDILAREVAPAIMNDVNRRPDDALGRAAVVDIGAYTRDKSKTKSVVTVNLAGAQNHCLQHCLAVQRVVEERAGGN